MIEENTPINERVYITLSIHRHNVVTILRVYDSPYMYRETATALIDVPKMCFDNRQDTASVKNLGPLTYSRAFTSREEPCVNFEGLECTLYMKILFGANSLEVREARHIPVNGQGKDVLSVFKTQFGEHILNNLFNTIALHDVEKMNNICSAIRTAAR